MSKKKKKFRLKKMKKPAIFVVIVLAILVIGGFSIKNTMISKQEKLSTISEASLKKVVEINEISTLNYTYNAVATVHKKESEKIKYYVAYNGTVTAGVDITKVKVQLDETEKKISVIVPNAEVHSVKVDIGSLEFIFEKEKYETETVSQEAYKACVEDLEVRASENKDLLELAKENALAAVKGLIEPWIEQIDEEYEIEFK